jgi:hypothetical protein
MTRHRDAIAANTTMECTRCGHLSEDHRPDPSSAARAPDGATPYPCTAQVAVTYRRVGRCLCSDFRGKGIE